MKICGRFFSKLDITSWLVWLFMILWQIVFIVNFNGEQFADFGEYTEKAQEIAITGSWYPRVDDMQGVMYLHAPGYINYLALLFRLTGSYFAIYLSNFLFIQVILFSCKSVIHQLVGGEETQKAILPVFQILFCIYFSLGMGGGIVIANTEMMFCAMTFSALAFLIRGRIGDIIIAGLLLGYANSIRPVTFILIPTIVWIICRNGIKGKIKEIAVRGGCFLASLIVMIASIGVASLISSGRFVYQSTTMGVNLLVGNSPVADGNNQYRVFEEGNIGYVSAEDAKDWTDQNYEQFYMEQALNWMKDNPLEVIRLIPARMFYLWATDTYFVTGYSGNTVLTDTTEYLQSVVAKILGLRLSELTFLDVMTCFSETYYLGILCLFVIATCKLIRQRVIRKYAGLYLMLIMGTLMHMFMFGYARFHFMYVIVFIMIIPIGICKRITSGDIQEGE